MKIQLHKHFSEEEQLAIALEYVNGNKPMHEIAFKYGVKSTASIFNWVAKFGLRKKALSLPKKPKTTSEMAKREGIKVDISELEEVNLKLQTQLEKAQAQILALNTMIDIAEEQGMDVRKKSGAKQ